MNGRQRHMVEEEATESSAVLESQRHSSRQLALCIRWQQRKDQSQ